AVVVHLTQAILVERQGKPFLGLKSYRPFLGQKRVRRSQQSGGQKTCAQYHAHLRTIVRVSLKLARDCGFSLTGSCRPAGAEGSQQRPVVEIIEIPSHRHALAEEGNLQRQASEPLGDVVCGGLTIDGGAQSKDDLLHLG